MALGYPHPDHLLTVLTPAQVAEWQAYNSLEPIGAYRRDYMEAQILAMIQNIAQAVYAKKGATPKPYLPGDYIPWNDGVFETTPAASTGAQSPADIKQLFVDLQKQFRAAEGAGTTATPEEVNDG